MRNEDKKILIISHNPLSRVYNNGKTLASIFEGVPKENLYQVYLTSGNPDYSDKCHYLQINEKQILESFMGRKNLCCKEVKPSSDTSTLTTTINTKSFGIYTKRLLRECVWKIDVWKSSLNDWLRDKQFDVVFFMAGDGMFAYDIYRFVMERTSAKGCMFFTDDYIIGKTSNSPVALFRQSLLKRTIQKTLKLVDELYVISEEMKQAYCNLLNVKGHVIRNFSVEKRANSNEKEKERFAGPLTIVYAGGLHYNRWEVLAQVAKALKQINAENSTKCLLKIFSAQRISRDIVNQIAIEGASVFCGSATAGQIADIYANADILLHVESFDRKAIAATKYSFSTKIPEYLSADKCVFAVGPAEVASISFLSEFACVVDESSDLVQTLRLLLSDAEYRNKIKLNCEQRYEKEFSTAEQKKCLNRILRVPRNS